MPISSREGRPPRFLRQAEDQGPTLRVAAACPRRAAPRPLRSCAVACACLATFTASLEVVRAVPYSVTFDTAKPLGIRLSTELAIVGFVRASDSGGTLPGEKSGWLRVGDVLLSVNGEAVAGRSLADVQGLIARASRPKAMVFDAANGANRTEQMQHSFGSADGMHGHATLLELFHRGIPLKLAGLPLPGLQAMFGGPIGCTPQAGALLAVAEPIAGCNSHSAREAVLSSRILIVRRGGCSFADKAVLAQQVGAAGLVVINDDDGGHGDPTANLRMPWDPSVRVDLSLPTLMLNMVDGATLLKVVLGGGASGAAPTATARRGATDPAAGALGPAELRGRMTLVQHSHLCSAALAVAGGRTDKFGRLVGAPTAPPSTADAAASRAGASAAPAAKDGDESLVSPSGFLLAIASSAFARPAARAAPPRAAGVPPALPRGASGGEYRDPTPVANDDDYARGEQRWLALLRARYGVGRLARRARGAGDEAPPAWLVAGNGADSGDAAAVSGAAPHLPGNEATAAASALTAPTPLFRGEYVRAEDALGAPRAPAAPLVLHVLGGACGGHAAASGSEAPEAVDSAGCLPYARGDLHPPVDASADADARRPFAVLVDRGGCPFHVKVTHAAAAGAALLIVANTDAREPLLRMKPLSAASGSSAAPQNAAVAAGAPSGGTPTALLVSVGTGRALRRLVYSLSPCPTHSVAAAVAADGTIADAQPADALEVLCVGDGGEVAATWDRLSALEQGDDSSEYAAQEPGAGSEGCPPSVEAAGVGSHQSASSSTCRSAVSGRWPRDRRLRRKLYMSLSRNSHPDAEGGNQERFEWLSRSYEAAEDRDDVAAAMSEPPE